ncbi:LAFE_0H07954g1_1 [Lachancea fermentati]|uniref:U6 snRNA phosphodiesterase 1 n=1 Tax=Lachancea fermentati TaxID=4955 RepID=A0A1G4MK51_LACFM|nr:LAFE_0H07954g1_1 [Lachancea fermentati]
MDILQSSYCSSSESEEEEELVEPVPIVPQAVLDKYSISPNIAKYQPGSEMNFVRGRWNTFAFIEMRTSTQQRALLNKTIACVNEKARLLGVEFEPLHQSEMGSPQPLHVSLSSNVEFSTRKELDLFPKMLSIELMQKFPLHFDVQFEPALKLFDNYDKSALFLTLNVSDSVKRRYLSKLSTIIQESIDCCSLEDNTKQRQQWNFVNAHMSIGKTSKTEMTKSYLHDIHGNSDQAELGFTEKFRMLNDVIDTVHLKNSELDQFSFRCHGLKVTKERANIWVPFGNSTTV